MSLVKYYDALFDEEKLNNEYVTYLSAIHMNNYISKRDNVTNTILKDLGANYSLKAYKFYESAHSPLTFLNDDIQVIYDYTKNHINKILENPHTAIIKEQKLIKKDKIKSIDAKTLRWLATKPGSSIREKLANIEKISSTVKRYSYNVKENQVVLAYFKDISRLISKKISIVSENKDLFGDESLIINNLKRELNKINYSFKNKFEEVVEKDHSSPNNALIGNVDYSSVWSSYLDLKQNSIDYSNAFDLYKKSFVNMFVAYLMNYYDFIEDTFDSANVFNYILYRNEDGNFTELLFDFKDSFKITINKYRSLYTINLVSNDEFEIKFDKVIEESKRGLAFNLIINDKKIGKYYADILGFKEIACDLLKYLELKIPTLKELNNIKLDYSFVSINSFDNKMYSNNQSMNISVCDNGTLFRNNSVSISNGKNLYFYSYKKDNYSRFLKLTSVYNENKNKRIIYDINDTFDEFSSASLRMAFSSVYPNSYPVWRSILAGESSWEKDSIRTVIDFCGKSFSISKLERKKEKDRFVHCGPIEVPIYYQIFNEFNFYESYLSKYEKKYNISFPNDVKNEFMSSGSLYSIFCKELNNCITCDGTKNNHNYYLVKYDDEIFESTLKEFEASFENILNKYDNSSTISILPDFLESLISKYDYVICNKNLINGANEIIDRLKNGEITWYEKLPKLSLEIIKNGMFDNLVLVDNQECENIIGKKFCFTVRDKLTLSKGNKNYILPLNKSFIGEQNDSFVAKAEDSSFPLDEDLEVKLIVEYSFAAENSYILKLKPISKPAPFDELIVKWEKELPNSNLIYPTIIDNAYTQDMLENDFNNLFPKLMNYISHNIHSLECGKREWVDKSNKPHNIIKDVTNNIRDLANKKQRLSFVSLNALNNIESLIDKNDIPSRILTVINYTNELKYTNYNTYLKRRISLEDSLIGITQNSNYILNNKLVFPYATYGRYFNMHPDDDKVINHAYNSLVEIVSKDDYINNGEIRIFIERMTSAIASRHKAIYEISLVNPSFTNFLLDVIIDILNKMSDFDWNEPYDDENPYGNNVSENGYLVRHCIELLISYLYCRELYAFNSLRPGKPQALKLINCLKKINYCFQNTKWDENIDFEKIIKIKYVIKFELSPELKNMLLPMYCLILYLSGDERANYIKIGSGD